MNPDSIKVPDFSLGFYRLRHDAARRFGSLPHIRNRFLAEPKKVFLTRNEIQNAISSFKSNGDSSLKLDEDEMRKNYWYVENAAPTQSGMLSITAEMNGIETIILEFKAENNIRQAFFEDPVVGEDGEQSRYEWLIETMLTKSLPKVSFKIV